MTVEGSRPRPSSWPWDLCGGIGSVCRNGCAARRRVTATRTAAPDAAAPATGSALRPAS